MDITFRQYTYKDTSGKLTLNEISEAIKTDNPFNISMLVHKIKKARLLPFDEEVRSFVVTILAMETNILDEQVKIVKEAYSKLNT
jgi:hypothetical protein